MISVDDVRMAYRLFLDREPESAEAIVTHLENAHSTADLRRRFLGSSEYRQKRAAGLAPAAPIIEVRRYDFWGREDRPEILLLKLDHIGDFVLALDAFRLIRDTWPKAHITLICGPWNKSIAEESGLFDTLVCYRFSEEITDRVQHDTDRAQKDTEAKLAEYSALPLRSYDLAIDFRCYSDSRILLSRTAAKYRAGYFADGVPLDLALPAGTESEVIAHIGGRTMALAAAVAWTFGTPPGDARDKLLNGRTPLLLFNEGISVGVSPGTRNAIRSWGRERFAELVQILHSSRNFQFVLIGGTTDRADTKFISEALPKQDVVDLAGTTAIADVPPIFAGLDLFIGGETGTTHIAALMGVPTVCIFSGTTNIGNWRPAGPHVVTLRGNVPCSPCGLWAVEQCPWDKRCMDIPPARVAAEAMALYEFVASASPSERVVNQDAIGVAQRS